MIPTEEYNRVLLRDVTVELSVGLHPWERHPERPQRVSVNVELFWRPRVDGRYVDYDPIRAAIRGWRDRPHVELIETLAEELVAICFADPLVDACRVQVLKLDIFPEAASAGVELVRRRPS